MNIDNLRLGIDIIDNKIAKLLEEREELVKEIGREKKLASKNILCKGREDEIIKRLQNNTKLDKLLVKKLWLIIIDHSKIIQSLI